MGNQIIRGLLRRWLKYELFANLITIVPIGVFINVAVLYYMTDYKNTTTMNKSYQIKKNLVLTRDFFNLQC